MIRRIVGLFAAAALMLCPVQSAAADQALALGDSITVGASSQLRAAGYEVDAEVGRSFAQGLAILRQRAGSLPPRIVVNLGTNSGVTAAQCSDLLGIVGPDRGLTLVTVNIPNAPKVASASNAVLANCAAKGGATLLDWAGYTQAHPDALCPDGIHISCGGASQYARFITGGAASAPAQPEATADAGVGPAPSPSAGATRSSASSRSPASTADPVAELAARERAAAEAQAAEAAAAAAREAAARQQRLTLLQGLGAPSAATAAMDAYDYVPVAVRLSALANS